MSTRATYQFLNCWMKKDITFYIHHDGYPAGVAEYFYNMHMEKNRRGGYAERFFRANENAEFTENHFTHADTEYSYTLNDKGSLIATEYTFLENGCRESTIIFNDHWINFVNKYNNELNPEEKLLLFEKEVVNQIQLKEKYIKELEFATDCIKADSLILAAKHIETATKINNLLNTWSK